MVNYRAVECLWDALRVQLFASEGNGVSQAFLELNILHHLTK